MMIELWDIMRYLFLPLILGSYGFTWAVYRALKNELEEMLVNHFAHEKEAREKLEAKVDSFIEGYNRSRR